MIAYKYRNMSCWTKEIFDGNQIFFPTASELNDPLDSSISINQGYEAAKKHLLNNDVTEDKRKCFLLFLLNSKSFGVNEGRKEMKLNDALQKFISKVGILSLSKTPLEPLMWSHYGDGHKGVCIGFNVEKMGVETVFSHGNVQYIAEPPYKQAFLDLVEEFGEIVRPWDNHKHTEEDADDFYTRQLRKLMTSNWFVKSEKWAYEKEYRLISSKNGSRKFEPESIVEIILGNRTNENDINWIHEILRKPEYSHVKLKSVYQVDGSFDFMLRDN